MIGDLDNNRSHRRARENRNCTAIDRDDEQSNIHWNFRQRCIRIPECQSRSRYQLHTIWYITTNDCFTIRKQSVSLVLSKSGGNGVAANLIDRSVYCDGMPM
jgi:hypothetical protein